MIHFSKEWYKNVANICQAYHLFYNKELDLSAHWKNKERIEVEFQVMVYLIEYGLEIVLGNGPYPTYSFSFKLNDSMPRSKLLKETTDYIIEHPEEIKKDMCTLDEDKKDIIKRNGRLFCIKMGNPSKLEDLGWMAKYYYNIHKSTGISRYHIMQIKESIQLLKDFTGENHIYNSNHIPNGCYSETNGFVGDEDREPLSLYQYLEEANRYRKVATGLADPFIHYAVNIPVFIINWDEAREQLKTEEQENSKKYKWVEDLHRVASKVTRESTIQFVEDRSKIINKKMDEIERREEESEILGMLENERYDDEEWDMLLGSNRPTSSLIKDDYQEQVLVKKKDN